MTHSGSLRKNGVTAMEALSPGLRYIQQLMNLQRNGTLEIVSHLFVGNPEPFDAPIRKRRVERIHPEAQHELKPSSSSLGTGTGHGMTFGMLATEEVMGQSRLGN